jgi:hypothetical protein
MRSSKLLYRASNDTTIIIWQTFNIKFTQQNKWIKAHYPLIFIDCEIYYIIRGAPFVPFRGVPSVPSVALFLTCTHAQIITREEITNERRDKSVGGRFHKTSFKPVKNYFLPSSNNGMSSLSYHLGKNLQAV